MKLKAIIFDVDGTIANTEREGHLPACNDAFAQLGYDIRWSWDAYKKLLVFTGTERRVRHALHERFPVWTDTRLDTASTEIADLKRQIYLDEYAAVATLRAGVRSLVASAVEQGVKLAIVSLSHEAQIEVMLQRQMPEFAGLFDPLLGKVAGPKHAPGSPLYTRCLAELGFERDAILVIEDSAGGTAAAVAAGLPVAVTYNDYTADGPFTGAQLVTPTLASFTLAQLSFLCLEQ